MSSTTSLAAPRLRLKARPRLETMEDRFCPSVTSTLNGSVLTINGDGASDQAQVTVTGDDVSVTSSGTTRTFNDVTQINMSLGAGNDALTLNLTAASSAIGRVLINGGFGNDLISLRGGAAGAGASLDLDVLTGFGNDFVDARFDTGASVAGSMTLDFDLGAGADGMTLGMGNTLAGSNVLARIFGRAGGDVILPLLTGDIAGNVDLRAALGLGNDSLSAFTRNVLSGGDLNVFVDGSFDNDRFALTRRGSIAGAFDVAANMGFGNDRALLVGTADLTSDGTLSANIDTGFGNDFGLLSATGDTNGALDTSWNLGAGNDLFQSLIGAVNSAADLSLALDAGAGVDISTLNFIGAVNGALDLALRLGDGNDQLAVFMRSLLANADLGLNLDAGAGNDFARMLWRGDIAAGATAALELAMGLGNDLATLLTFGDVNTEADLPFNLDGGPGLDFLRAGFGDAQSVIDLLLSSVEQRLNLPI